ncbi:MAG: 30S ribosome-binding factor RbfA [Oscillospiraceae bacterium]|jgi:ribosome-binding factor A|nr:30S ribosome-binding factor RbfA [Oscillospiraceae bacterium]
MPTHRHDRVEEDVKRELSALLREVKDYRVRDKFLTLVRVQMSGDGSVANVYVSAMDGNSSAKEAAKGLQSAAGFLRGELARRLHLRKAPELNFNATAAMEEGARITKMIGELVNLSDEEGSE